MLDWTQTIILALIQGLSEFLPISSSAHLVLPAQLLFWNDQGLLFDVFVHGGTLIAVMIYFRADLIMLFGTLRPGAAFKAGSGNELWLLAAATIPTVLVGLLFNDAISGGLRGLPVIAFTTLFFGILMGVAAQMGTAQTDSNLGAISWRDACLIGLAQSLALVPGVSRSGVTITAALMLGYNLTTAARFSFLLSIPVILMAMTFMGFTWFAGEARAAPVGQLLIAMLVAGLSAYATIAVFLGILDRIGLMPFVWYRLILGCVLVVVIILS
ncbi:MAG: undecaprenyl-diphosphate phosphatase [Luminiphilus sp.]|nr:undecaprenyl-diphosphate phosphatase [Luminiphilus sp.]